MKKRLKRITSLFLAVLIAATSAAYAPPASGSTGGMPFVALEAAENLATPSEAVRTTPSEADNTALSDAVPNKEVSTPSQAEKTFVQVEPEEEEIPEYYSRVSEDGKKFWKFEDRNGSVQYRDYGYIQGEAEFPLWYCLTAEGDLDIGNTSPYPSGVDLNDEYRTLAPYLFKSVEPTEESWKALEDLISTEGGLDTQNKEELRGFQNWDQTEYSIYHLTAKEPAEESKEPVEEMPGDAGQTLEDLGYFFYGSISNAEDLGTCWWYADENGNVLNIVRIRPFMALAAAAKHFSFYWDTPGVFRPASTTNNVDVTTSTYKLTGVGDNLESHVCVYGTGANERIIDFESRFIGWSTVRTENTGLTVQWAPTEWSPLQDDPAKLNEYLVAGTLYPSNYIYEVSDYTWIYNFYGVWAPKNAETYVFMNEPYHGDPKYEPYKINSIIVRRDTTYQLNQIALPSKEGFTFNNWFIGAPDLLDVDPNDTLSFGHSGKVFYVYPIFTAKENTVRFLDIDGNLLSEQIVPSGSSAVAPTPPKLDHKVFSKWDKDFTNVTSDITVRAVYEDTVIVTFDAGEGLVYGNHTYSVEIKKGSAISSDMLNTIESNTKKKGFTGYYWELNYDGNGNDRRFNTLYGILNDKTVYVKWTVTKIYMTFYRNHPLYPDTKYTFNNSFHCGNTIESEIKEKYSVYMGYKFLGWSESKTGGTILPNDYVVWEKDANKTLYGKWAITNIHAHLNYDWDGCEINGPVNFPSDITFQSDLKGDQLFKNKILKNITASDKIKKNGYLPFWYDEKGDVIDRFTWDAYADDMEFYLKWVPDTINYKVLANTTPTDEREVGKVEPKYLSYGECITKFPDVSLFKPAGKIFVGWSTDKQGIHMIDTTTPLYPKFDDSWKQEESNIYAQWANISSKITFKDWDGTVLSEQTVNYGDAIDIPETPKRAGYNFIGWDADVNENTKFANDTIITAQYTINSYQLTLNANGGTLDGEAAKTLEFAQGESFDQALADGAAEANRKHYTFAGWYTEPTGGSRYGESGNIMPASAVTVYAHWTRSSSEVIYKDYDGTVLKQQEVAIGEDATPPADPVRPGYTFTGWDKLSTNIQDHVTITAQYTINGYLLTLDGNGGTMNGSAAKEQMISFAESFDQALISGRDMIIRPGYHFDGWYDRSTGGSSYSYSGNQMPAADVTVYAHWTANSYKVTFDPDHKRWSGGTTEETYTFDTELGALPSPEIYGWKFTGWRTGPDGTGTMVTEHSMVEPKDVTYYGSWEPETYQIHFVSKAAQPNGEAVQTFTVSQSYDSPLGTLPVPAESGYTFTGWYDDNGEKVSAQTIFCPDSGAEDYTYHAGWVANTYKIHFTYEDLDGKPVIIEMDGTYFTQIGTLPTPEKPGYTFIGWFKDNGEEVTAGSWVEAGDTVYKARWKANQYTIHFKRNLPDSVITENPEDQTVTYGLPIGELPVLHETGYLFLGWYTEPTGGKRIRETTPAALGDQTYYAHWLKEWMDHGNGTHSRPGVDGVWETDDDELWWNGPDGIPGTDDDRIIIIGGDGSNPIDYIDNGDGTHTRPGAGGSWSDGDTEHWWNGPDGIPGTDDDRIIIIGGDGRIDYIDNGDGTYIRPGADGTWNTEDDEVWLDGPDDVPGTPDDSKKDNGGNSGKPTEPTEPNKPEPTEPNKPEPTEPNKPDPTEPTKPEPGNTVPDKDSGKDQEKEILITPPASPIDTATKPAVPDTGGTFTVNPENPYDVTYTKPDGTPAKDEWVGDGKDWYHVDEDGKLSYDWYLEEGNTWYKLNKETGDRFGAALVGWNFEPMDDRRYFFDPSTTKMLTGWQNIDGKWYYFTKQNEAQTYFGNNRTGWKYDPTKPGKPYGSLYQNENTPDGYQVDENGVWINKKRR